MKPQVVRRQRRSDPSPILRMVFPAAYTDEQVTEKMQSFGLVGYDVQRSDGIVSATRGDLKSISPDTTTDIMLTADGIRATVLRTESVAENPKSGLTVVSLVFRSDTHNAESVSSWLKEKGMDAKAPEGGSGDYIVQRVEVAADEETRVVELEPGVSAVVVRSDGMDIPDGFVAVVNETCYGNWGWGQLDFAASMADTEFSRVMDDAVCRLRHVLDQILLYSALPLAERKTLMVNALGQFQTFAVGILDSLPRTILVAVARSASPTKENPEMTTNATGGATPTAATSPPASGPVTRADIASVVQELLPGILADALKSQTVARSAGGEDTQPPASQEKTDEPTTAPITRADVSAAVVEALKPLVERVERVEGTTVLRSDAGDLSVSVNAAVTGNSAPKDVFRGASVFGGLGLKRAS